MILPAPASQLTAAFLKYASFAMWHASAAWWPNTASSATGLRVLTASKKVNRCGFTSSHEVPRQVSPSIAGSFPGGASCSCSTRSRWVCRR